MSLKDNLYFILSCENGKSVIRLNPSSPVYAAHFPGHPITPGVILIEIATELLSEEACVCGGAKDDCANGRIDGGAGDGAGGCIDGVAGKPLELAEAVNVKFVSPVIPAEDTLLTYLFSPDGDLRWKITVFCCGALCAKMTLQYR